MLLSNLDDDLIYKSRMQIVRDASFDALAYVTHKINRKRFLAYAATSDFVTKCTDNPLVSAIITTRELAGHIPESCGLVVSDDPARSFYNLHKVLCAETEIYWKNFANQIHPTAQISKGAIIASNNVKIGAGTVVEAGAIIKDKVIIGSNCIIGSGSIIGCQGFEFKDLGKGLEFIPHGAGVVIGDNVHVFEGCKIMRGLFSQSTIVNNNSALDVDTLITHGVQIGENVLVAANACLCAAVIVEDGVRIDPNAAIVHEVTIGKGANITIGAVVTKDVPPHTKVTGNFAYEHSKFMKNLKKQAN